MPAPALFAVSGVTQYAGAAVAVGLFDVVAAPVVAWLRIAVAALVLLIWQRPWRSRWDRRRLLTTGAFGVVLAAMNVSFYVAIAHLPLGTAVAVEFIGPVAVAAVTGRTARERWAIVVAFTGVVLLAGISLRLGSGAVTGLVAIFVAAGFWAGYIVLGRRVARAVPRPAAAHGPAAAGGALPDAPAPQVDAQAGGGLVGLALAMGIGAVVFAPLAAGAGAVLRDWRLAAAVVAVAVLSSVVPYGVEQVVMRRVSAATFAVLLAILPASAAVVGAVMLHQWPHGLEILGLALVTGAIVLTAPPRRPTT
ncbi:MAG: EamA family transporter [Actinobacteria bacterium]|nr:EamA family transporter [Actinomycetota bacterium]MCG2802730.1 EamA family transporter [Cellulomonas sp.]